MGDERCNSVNIDAMAIELTQKLSPDYADSSHPTVLELEAIQSCQ